MFSAYSRRWSPQRTRRQPPPFAARISDRRRLPPRRRCPEVWLDESVMVQDTAETERDQTELSGEG